MKLGTILKAAGATLGALAFSSATMAADPIDVRYGLWAKEGEAQYIGAVKFKELLEAASGGRYKVTIYPGNQLGTPREMQAQLALNDTQIMASGDPGMKEIEYLALPYLMAGIKNYIDVISSPIGDAWNEKLVKTRKMRLFGFLPRSPRQISTNKPINVMADLEGLKLRAPERDYYVESLTALGAKPTPMAFKEVYTALQTGLVDGQENPIETIYASKFYEVQKAVAMVDYIDKPAYVMIGDPFWSKLPDADKEMFLKAMAESTEVVAALLPEQEKKFIAEMKAKGITFTYPDKAEFIAATQSVRDKLGTKIWGAETYAKIVEMGAKSM